MKLLRLHVLGLVLLACGLTMDTGSACCMGGGAPKPSVPSINVRPNVPRPDLSGVTRDARDAASRNRDARDAGSGNSKGTRSGKTACKNCGCPDCASDGGVPASQTARTAVQTQQAAADKAYADYQAAEYFEKTESGRWAAALGLEALGDAFNLAYDQRDNAKVNHSKLKQKYLDDPTAENDRLAKEAERAFLDLENTVRDRGARNIEAHDRYFRETRDSAARSYDLMKKWVKEFDKLQQLKVKLAQVVGAELLDSLPD